MLQCNGSKAKTGHKVSTGAMFLLTSTKKSFSTEEIRRQLGHKRYQPILPWVHIVISNAKRLLLDVHHKLKNEYLPKE